MLCPFGIIDTTILSTCLSLPGVPVASLLGGGRGTGVQFKYPHSPNATEPEINNSLMSTRLGHSWKCAICNNNNSINTFVYLPSFLNGNSD